MEQSADYSYCIEELKSLQLTKKYPKALSLIASLIRNNRDDACKYAKVTNCFAQDSTIYVVNMDAVEHQYAAEHDKQPEPSADMGFTVKKVNGTVEFVLSELKLNVCSPKNVTMADMDLKIAGSLKHLNECTLHKNIYFIFADNRKEEARSNFQRLQTAHNFSPCRKAIDLTQLKKLFFLSNQTWA